MWFSKGQRVGSNFHINNYLREIPEEEKGPTHLLYGPGEG